MIGSNFAWQFTSGSFHKSGSRAHRTVEQLLDEHARSGRTHSISYERITERIVRKSLLESIADVVKATTRVVSEYKSNPQFERLRSQPAHLPRLLRCLHRRCRSSSWTPSGIHLDDFTSVLSILVMVLLTPCQSSPQSSLAASPQFPSLRCPLREEFIAPLACHFHQE